MCICLRLTGDYASSSAVRGWQQTLPPAAEQVRLKTETERIFLLLFDSFPDSFLFTVHKLKTPFAFHSVPFLSSCDCFRVIVDEIWPLTQHFSWNALNRFSSAHRNIKKARAVFTVSAHVLKAHAYSEWHNFPRFLTEETA